MLEKIQGNRRDLNMMAYEYVFDSKNISITAEGK
jgi:hypothetical protein